MWLCPKCSSNNDSNNNECVYCRSRHNIHIKRAFDLSYELGGREHAMSSDDKTESVAIGISIKKSRGAELTPQEELFAKFFSHENILVADMDDLTLSAHREEIAGIAFEARARLTAIDEGIKERKKRKLPSQGFERNLNSDDISSDAINTVKKRQERMTKADKVREGLEKMGLDTAAIDKIMSARNISDTVKAKNNEKPDLANSSFMNTPAQKELIRQAIAEEIEVKEPTDLEKARVKFVNPFAK